MLFIIILVLSLIAGFITPWWAAAIIAFVTALYAGKKSGQAFWSGFLAVFVAWVVLIMVKSIPNNYELAGRVGVLFYNLPVWALVIVTAIFGGLVGGMSAWSGLLVRRAFSKSVEPHV